MKLKPWHFYIWIASALVSILLIAGFAKEVPPLASKISAAYDKTNPAASSKPFKPFACKGKTVFACTVKYLHYLRYLPISRTGAHRYEFSFPVSKVLLNSADSYAWNSQNPFVLGAVEQYLEVSGKLKDGEHIKPEINRTLLSRLEKSAANGEFDPNPWKWVLVRQAMKGESVELYENGRKVFSSPANTGEFATTPDGTWYIFLRFRDTTMSGLSPARISLKVYKSLKLKHPKAVGCLDGHPVKWVAYDDSGIKYVDYFNGGIALHYIFRPRYGFPQSAGCVELPHRDAKFLHKNIGYGTIVTVSGIAEHAATKKHGDTNADSEACTLPTRPVKDKPK
ncbi:MAG: L,D-transpeptidase [bacterium]